MPIPPSQIIRAEGNGMATPKTVIVEKGCSIK
jgi:hypothetical protein